MLHSLSRIGLAIALCGLLLVPSVALAQKDRPRKVHDEAKLFSQEAIDKANTVIATIKEKHHKDLYIDTVEKGPADNAGKWAQARFNDFGIDGVYIVFSKAPTDFRIIVGNKTEEKGYFTSANRKEVEEIIKKTMSKNRDEALLKTVNHTLDVMNEHARAKPEPAPVKKGAQPQPVQQPAPQPAPGGKQEVRENAWSFGGMSIWGWALLIGGVLLVVWIVSALIRAMTGGMGGGYGGAGGYGGGGGGFLTGMLGGLFGAMAGMYLYNTFFGGHANYQTGDWGGGNQGNQGGATGSEADTDGSASGGDYGADQGGDAGGKGGGDDAGGGGGDWGGGGDAGGGDAGGGSACGGGGCGGGGGGD